MDKSTLIDHLNQDLAEELAAVIQYSHYAARIQGPFRLQLRAFFLAEIKDEQGHVNYLSDKIVSLGGVPATIPAPVKTADQAVEMLQFVAAAEQKAVQNYTQRIAEAEALGELELKIKLEDMVANETHHLEETQKLLNNWPRNKARSNRQERFNFGMLRMDKGTMLHFKDNNSVTCEVANNIQVKFRGKLTYLSPSASIILKEMGYDRDEVQGTLYWCFKGRSLNDLRLESGK